MNSDYAGQDAPQEREDDALAPSAESNQPGAQNGMPEPEVNMEDLLRDNDYAFRSLKRGETVEGTVVRVDQDEVLVDVGMKSEGVIPSREMYSEDEDDVPLQIGDRTLVYVVQPEGSEGHAILSLRRARLERSWREIDDIYHRGAVVDAPVVDFNKGGLIVDVKAVRGFVPVSQVLDLRNVGRQEGRQEGAENEEISHSLAAMKGRRLPLKIIEINRSRNRLILSERAAVQEQRTARKDELLDQLEPGQVRRGTVSNLTTFGAFIDLGGADGLVHVSELSYNRVNHPSEILRVGQEVEVAVLSIDRESKKIALSLKRALPDPWTSVEEKYRVGEVVSAVITKLAKFGAFAKVEEGLEGLIHLSELTDLQVNDPAKVVHEGQPVNAKIIHINSQRRRLGLSVRQAAESRQPNFQSFGDADTNSPFASHNFADYAPGVETNGASSSEPSTFDDQALLSPKSESFPTGEQEAPAPEFEPAISPIGDETAAVVPEETSPVSPEASLSGKESEEESESEPHAPQPAVTE